MNNFFDVIFCFEDNHNKISFKKYDPFIMFKEYDYLKENEYIFDLYYNFDAYMYLLDSLKHRPTLYEYNECNECINIKCLNFINEHNFVIVYRSPFTHS